MKINIATPEYGHTYVSEYVKSLYLLTKKLEQSNVPSEFSWISYNDIVEVRNFLISNFYFRLKDCTHLLFIDADMGFPSDVIMEMLEFNKPVVGVAATKREYNPSIKDEPTQAASYNPKEKKNGFIRVDQCGAGVLLISRRCIDEMVKKMPEIVDNKYFKAMPFGHLFKSFLRPFDKVATSKAILSDDLSFCHRWTEGCGGEIWVNDKYQIDHVGRHVFSSVPKQ